MKIPRDLQLKELDIIHLTWRCCDSDNQHLLRSEAAKDLLLPILVRNKEACGIRLYDYCLMDNHVHLVMKISTVKRFIRFLLRVHTSYAKQINKLLRRTGQVIKDRAQVAVIKDEYQMLHCQAYLHCNPWACERQISPASYRHSGFAHYATNARNPDLDTSPAWLELAETDEERQRAFAQIVEEKMAAREEQRTRKMIKRLDCRLRYFGDEQYIKARSAALQAEILAGKERRLSLRIARDQEERHEMALVLASETLFSGSVRNQR